MLFKYNIYIVVQCCEHLNRVIVIEKQVLEKHDFEEVYVNTMLELIGFFGK